MVVRSGTVVLLLTLQPDGDPVLLESLSDEREVEFVEEALKEGHPDPVWALQQRRRLQKKEDEEFADYIEQLVSEPHCRIEVQDHAAQWFQSRLQLEKFQCAESEARRIIAEFALKVFHDDPSRTDFVLAGPSAEVRVRIHLVPRSLLSETA
jgi:hypothetical protein